MPALFSGGNQQKLIVGREFYRNPKVVIIAHPTRGVDIGVSEIIHQSILKLREAGSAILLITADFDELFKLSDRIGVIYEGHIVTEGKREEYTPNRLEAYIWEAAQMKIKRFEKLVAPVLSIIIALLIGTAIIKICGYHPLSAYSALLKGAFGSFRYTMATLEKSVPLILCGIAAMVAMKSGIFNIGAEGQLFMGAIGYAVAALYLDFLPGSLHLIVCILVSILFGGAWAFVPAIMKIRIGANEVVTSIMLNYIAQLLPHIWFLAPCELTERSLRVIRSLPQRPLGKL